MLVHLKRSWRCKLSVREKVPYLLILILHSTSYFMRQSVCHTRSLCMKHHVLLVVRPLAVYRHMADGMEADTLGCVYLLPLSYRRLEKEGFALLFQEMNAAFAM